jgi:hypothetical protein
MRLSARLRGLLLLLTIALLVVAALRLVAQGGTPAFWLRNLGSMAAFIGLPLAAAILLGWLGLLVSRRFGDR